MKRFIQHRLFFFSLIAALLLDIGGSVVDGCVVETSSECGCCCSQVDQESSCCDSSQSVRSCNCSASDETPASPPVRQTNRDRQNYQRTVVVALQLPINRSSMQCGGIEDSSLHYLLSSTRRRASLCCWMT